MPHGVINVLLNPWRVVWTSRRDAYMGVISWSRSRRTKTLYNVEKWCTISNFLVTLCCGSISVRQPHCHTLILPPEPHLRVKCKYKPLLLIHPQLV